MDGENEVGNGDGSGNDDDCDCVAHGVTMPTSAMSFVGWPHADLGAAHVSSRDERACFKS